MSSSLMSRLKTSFAGNTNANTIDPPASKAQAEEDTMLAPAAAVMDRPLSYTNVSHHDELHEGVLVVPRAVEENKDTSSELSLSPNQLSDSVLEDLKLGSKTDLDMTVSSQPRETVGLDPIESYHAESEEEAVLVDEPLLTKDTTLAEKKEEEEVVTKAPVQEMIIFAPVVEETVHTPKVSLEDTGTLVVKAGEEKEATRTLAIKSVKTPFLPAEGIMAAFRRQPTVADTEVQIFASSGDVSTGTTEETDVINTLMRQATCFTYSAGFLLIAALAFMPAAIPMVEEIPMALPTPAPVGMPSPWMSAASPVVKEIPMDLPTSGPVAMFIPSIVPTYRVEQLAVFVEAMVETVETRVRAKLPTPAPAPEVLRTPTVVPAPHTTKPVAFVEPKEETSDKNTTSASGWMSETFYSTSLFLGVICILLFGQVSQPKLLSEDGGNLKTEGNDMLSLNSIEGMLAFHQTFVKSGKGRRIFMDSHFGVEAYETLSCIELFLILDGFGHYANRYASKRVLICDLASKYEKALHRFTCADIKQILGIKGYTVHAHMSKKEMIALAVQAAF